MGIYAETQPVGAFCISHEMLQKDWQNPFITVEEM